METTLSPKEGLELIADAISRTKENVKDNSFYFLLWGWLVAISSFSSFLLMRYTDVAFYTFPFPITAAIGVITSIIVFNKRKSTSTQTYLTYFLSRLWVVLGACFFLVVFLNVSQGRVPFTYTLLMAGIGTLVSGWVMKFRPLIIGGVLFLLFAVSSVYVADDMKLLIHGIAIITGYLAPGYMLKMSKQNG